MTNKELIDKILDEILHLKMKELQRTNGVNTGADVYLSSYAVLSILSNALTEEREDERIRKWLVDYFSSIKATVWIHRDISCEQILAWLEKQKEPTKEELYAEAGTTENEYIANTMKMVRAMREKQKEQKPHLELKAGKWYICHRAFCARADHLTVKEGERFQCEKDGIVKGFVIKEPEKYFKECGAPAPMEDEQKEQKPAWSEEDERRIDAICELLENTSAIHPNYSRRELIIWLKSLRPSWKPSEEQIEALRKAVNILAKTDVADSIRLSIMYDNLKKR